MLEAALTEFFSWPWQNVAGFFGALIAVTVLFGKWVPGVKNLIESIVGWLGDLFTASLRIELSEIRKDFRDHTQDPEAHHRISDHKETPHED